MQFRLASARLLCVAPAERSGNGRRGRAVPGPRPSWQLPWASLFGLALMRETTEAQATWDARARVILRRLEAATHPHKDGLRSASP